MPFHSPDTGQEIASTDTHAMLVGLCPNPTIYNQNTAAHWRPRPGCRPRG